MSPRSDTKATGVTVGVDWISATLGRDEIDDQVWLQDAYGVLYEVQKLGNTYKRRSLLGFDGWESGGCFVGSNNTRHYAQFAGKYANDAYRFLEHPKIRVSRIDIQVTVQYDTDIIREGKYQYARAIHHNKELPEYRRRKVNLFAGSDGGDTVYIGSPASDTRGRIYNKHKQSGLTEYERSWRYEVVYRNQYALRMYGHLINQDNAASQFITEEVAAWFSQRGVNILDIRAIGADAIAPPKAPSTDVERKLRWVKNQVIPTIRKLAELGYAEELMELIAEAIAAARNEQV